MAFSQLCYGVHRIQTPIIVCTFSASTTFDSPYKVFHQPLRTAM